MRVVFLGNAPWSVPSLEALAASRHRPVLVLTRSARLSGRGNQLQRTPVAEATERVGLALMEVDTVKTGSGFDALREAAPEVLVVVAYGEILPSEVLAIPSVAPVNLHFSLLPELRGAAPVQRAILQGLDRTGVTTIRMDEGVDTGPVLLQAEESIRPDDDSGSLGQRLAQLGGGLLVMSLDGFERGQIDERPQDDRLATQAPKLTADDRVIRWEDPGDDALRRIAAMSPEPGAETRFRDRLLKVYRASGLNDGQESIPEGRPGEILHLGSKGIVVATGGRPVVLEEVQPEGKRRMAGEEFVRGYRPELGEILG